MTKNKQILSAMMSVMESLLETDRLEDALSDSLNIIIKALEFEEGVIWVLDKVSDRLYPLICIGPADVSNISIENRIGIPGISMETCQTVIVPDAPADPRYDGSIFEENGLSIRSLLCVPIILHGEAIGCIQILNGPDGEFSSEDEVKLCERMAALTAMVFEDRGFAFQITEGKEPIIRLRNIIKEFPSGESVSRVLKGINLDIYRGEFLVILGESGCGKSTLVNIIGGMDFLTDGTLLIDGKDFSHPSDKELTQFRRDYMGLGQHRTISEIRSSFTE